MVIEISDQLVKKTGISSKDILLKIAISFFQEEQITLGQASKLAGLHQIDFQKELSKRNISIHYNEEQYLNDLKMIELI